VRSRPLRRGGRRRSRPVLVWVVVIAALVAVAVVAARTFRPALPGRGPTPGPARTDVQVFFVRSEPGGRAQTLAAGHRRVVDGPVEALAAAALRAMLEGPSRAERSRGLTTEIPPGTSLRGVTLGGGLATVDLGVAFAQGGGSSSILARVWQVVYTASQFPDVSSVQLLIGGRRVDTLGGEGLLIGAPMRRPAAMPTF
jgi:spore germination protein GerM